MKLKKNLLLIIGIVLVGISIYLLYRGFQLYRITTSLQMLEIPVETGKKYVLGYKIFPIAGLVGLIISWILITINNYKKKLRESSDKLHGK